MSDLTRWVAESDPIVRAYDEYGAAFSICFYCEEGFHFSDDVDHAPDCQYVRAREQMERNKAMLCPLCGVNLFFSSVRNHLVTEHSFPAHIFADHLTMEQLRQLANPSIIRYLEMPTITAEEIQKAIDERTGDEE